MLDGIISGFLSEEKDPWPFLREMMQYLPYSPLAGADDFGQPGFFSLVQALIPVLTAISSTIQLSSCKLLVAFKKH